MGYSVVVCPVIVGCVISIMVRAKKVANKGKGKAPASSSEQATGIVWEMEEEEEMIANPESGRAK